MSDAMVKSHSEARSAVKGLLAGFIGGLAGTAAKTVADKVFPQGTHGEPLPPDAVVESLGGGELSSLDKTLASETIHWVFGGAAGAAYGALVEYYPAASSKEGASFGIALATLTQEGALPALGLVDPTEDGAKREHTSQFTSHVVYGVVTEIVRSLVRKML